MKRLILGLLVIISIGHLGAQTIELWGTTNRGGEFGGGTIFKTDANGDNHSIQKSFLSNEGESPLYTSLCEAINGKLYGMTRYGGNSDKGVLFEYDPTTNTYTKKIDFDGTMKGANPSGSLILASNGKMYGMTRFGGLSNSGVIFEYDPTSDEFSKISDFDSVALGRGPTGSLMEGSDGKLFGMTQYGGNSDYGVLFELDIATNEIIKHLDFEGAGNGRYPNGSLIQAANDKYYGTTWLGGASDGGVLFEYDAATRSLVRYVDFDGISNGKWPIGSLLEASNGKLYGMTKTGGDNFNGVLFEFDPSSNAYFKLVDFDQTLQGSGPSGSLIEGNDGHLYGLTGNGGELYRGVLFEYDFTTSTYSKKLDFDGPEYGGSPNGSLMKASNGKFYGMTTTGGISGLGVIFEFEYATNIYTKKVDLSSPQEGYQPYSSLMHSSNGKFYGMTHDGGSTNKGVLYEFDAESGEYTHKLDFGGVAKGSSPMGYLVEASNGKLYGMTSAGGEFGYGVLFEYDLVESNFSKKVDFDRTNNGASPFGSLMVSGNGKIYGLTAGGGADNSGVIFEFDPTTDIFLKKADLDQTATGKGPVGQLSETDNGKFYGFARDGGSENLGTLFEYDLSTNSLMKKIDFDGAGRGSVPYGTPIQAPNGNLYGMTVYGGEFNGGVLFEYNLSTESFRKIIDFDGTNMGKTPIGSLMLASNGKLYGGTRVGGSFDLGVLFEYDPSTDIFLKKLDFDGVNGQNPLFGNLIEVEPVVNGAEDETRFNINKVSVYPNPNSGTVNVELGGLSQATVNVLTLDGRVVYQKRNVSGPNLKFDFTEPPGLYIVEVSTEGQMYQFKLIQN